MSVLVDSFFGDADLLMGANSSSDVVVDEIVIFASKGGGQQISIEYDYYRDYVDWQAEATPQGFVEWTAEFKAEIKAFADAHVLGDSSTDAYKQAHDAVSVLYALSKLGAVNPHETGWRQVNNHTFNWSELLRSLEHIDITVAPHNGSTAAEVDTSGAINHIKIDPTRVSAYDPWFSSPAESINYMIYHELGHAVEDGETDRNDPNIGEALRETRANRYGQVLAAINGAEYPSTSELAPFGGS